MMAPATAPARRRSAKVAGCCAQVLAHFRSWLGGRPPTAELARELGELGAAHLRGEVEHCNLLLIGGMNHDRDFQPVKPKAPFRPVFQVAVIREGSGVVQSLLSYNTLEGGTDSRNAVAFFNRHGRRSQNRVQGDEGYQGRENLYLCKVP